MELQQSLLALIISFVISATMGPLLIPLLKRMKFGQVIREEGPKSHQKKAGTPTMGGFIFMLSTILTLLIMVVFFGVEFNEYLKITIFVFVSYGLLGFADDFLKILKKDNEGLNKRQKFFGQILIAVVFYYLFQSSGFEPVLKIHTFNININMGWFYGVFILFMLVGTSNAVNLSDGLDGLCAGLSIIAFVTYGLIAVRRSTDISEVLALGHFSFALVGGLLGFLIYNYNPAKVFMGDVGALSLGGALATIAILTRHELTLIIVGSVFVIETLSVIIQVISFKTTGRRVFLMSPIHHHFELLGWEEKQIVRLFWIVGLISSLLALLFGVWS